MSVSRIWLLAPVLALGLVAIAPTMAVAQDRQVLPTDVRPSHYDVALHPDADHLTFTGTAAIDVTAERPAAQVVLNAKGLIFDRVSLDGVPATAVSLDAKLDRATMRFARSIAAGAHKLVIAYHGAISRGTFGFFAMDYDTAAGKRRTLATNFEPAGARLLLPCWDEPSVKATLA